MRNTDKLMTTADYVKKYKLNVDDKFNHAAFVSDMKRNFNKLITADIRKNGAITEKRFNNNVRCMRKSFDAINNKTVGNLSPKLFNFFYANVVVTKKNSFFKR
jgi:hypothetical protein